MTADGKSSLHALAGVPDHRQIVLAPAAIGPAADVALLVEAGAQALLDHPDHVLLIFGPVRDPDYHAHCASLVREWSLRHRALKGRLLLSDGLTWEACVPLIGQAALVVFPSADLESAPLVAAAVSANVPVLVRSMADSPAMVRDGETGLQYAGLTDFVRQYRRLFADPDLRRLLSLAAREAGLHARETPAG
jgi:glycosyltransferase involved in cell wall biosynthesis